MKYYLLAGGLIGLSWVCALCPNNVTFVGSWYISASFMFGVLSVVSLAVAFVVDNV